jgi:cell division protein FtsQ
MSAAVPVPFDVRLMNLAATVLFAAGALGFVAAGAWWAVRHPKFAISGITVHGEVSHNSVPMLRANVAPKLAGNFFTLNLERARGAFQAVPWVRQAEVRREFPNRLKVMLQEHHPVAYWGPEGESKLLNEFGEVFDANVDDVEQDDMPRLAGPVEQAPQVLAMYRTVKPLFEVLDLGVVELTLTARGNWRAELDNGGVVELGRGDAQEVTARVQRFIQTLTQVALRNGRNADALVHADLRYGEGYALRLRGVATTVAEAGKK